MGSTDSIAIELDILTIPSTTRKSTSTILLFPTLASTTSQPYNTYLLKPLLYQK